MRNRAPFITSSRTSVKQAKNENMKKNISISIIVPTYNNEKYIEECIDSIINQFEENDDYEVIIVNDGSTDNTEKILEKYKTSNKIRIILTANMGVSHARNIGLKIASCEYITFVDSDDYLLPSTYTKIIETIKKNDRPDLLRYNYINDASSKRYSNSLYGFEEKLINAPAKNKLFKERFLIRCHSIPNLCQLLFIKKKLAKKIRFNEELRYMEDVIFYQDLFENASNIYMSSIKGYVLRELPTSATKSNEYIVRNLNCLISVNNWILSHVEYISSQKVCETHIRLIAWKLQQLRKISPEKYSQFIKSTVTRKNISKIAKKGKNIDALLMHWAITGKNYNHRLGLYLGIRELVWKIKNGVRA